MRLRAVTYARWAAGLIEERATEIAGQAEDPKVRKAALLWKLRAIPLVHEAALQPDPLLAAGDLWALSLQMEAFFSDGAGRDVFGPHQPIAVATCEEVAVRGESVVQAAVGGADVGAARGFVERFARENPILTRSLRRESLSLAFADVLFADSRSAFATVGDMEQTARDIDYRLGFMSDSVLKQARWTAELALLDAIGSGEVREAVAGLEESIETLRRLADRLPAVIELERNALFGALAGEREATLTKIDAQRVDTLMTLARERQAVFDGIDEQREAILSLLRSEREAVLADVEGVVDRSLVSAVDHAIWRLLQIGLAAALVVLPARWLWPRGRRSSA